MESNRTVSGFNAFGHATGLAIYRGFGRPVPPLRSHRRPIHAAGIAAMNDLAEYLTGDRRWRGEPVVIELPQ